MTLWQAGRQRREDNIVFLQVDFPHQRVARPSNAHIDETNREDAQMGMGILHRERNVKKNCTRFMGTNHVLFAARLQRAVSQPRTYARRTTHLPFALSRVNNNNAMMHEQIVKIIKVILSTMISHCVFAAFMLPNRNHNEHAR